MHTLPVYRHSAYIRLQSTLKIVQRLMWYVDIYFFSLFSVRHAIIQNVQSMRAVIPLLAGYSLRVAAEVVAMTIILQFSVTVTAQFCREDFEKVGNFLQVTSLLFFSFSFLFEPQKQTTERRASSYWKGRNSLCYSTFTAQTPASSCGLK